MPYRVVAQYNKHSLSSSYLLFYFFVLEPCNKAPTWTLHFFLIHVTHGHDMVVGMESELDTSY